jgi:hypothetical protein
MKLAEWGYFMRNLFLGFVISTLFISLTLVAQDGLSKYERIVNLEARVSKIEADLARLRAKGGL